VEPRGLKTADSIEWRLKPLRSFFGSRLVRDIKTADVEDFIADLRKPRRVNRQADRVLSPASINRSLQLLRAILNWAVAREHLERSPFRRGSETLIRLFKEDNKRRRRISEDEEQRLLDAAPPILRAMIISALDTGMRRGEMLALRFGDIDWAEQTIMLRGPTTKSGKTTKIPIATLRLKAVLEWLRLDGAGQPKPDDAPVFSNGAGEPIRRFRTAWVSTVLKAHGTKPRWSKGGAWKSLTPECQARFLSINLHWHDTRHEYASRLDERGVPLSQIRDLLGHASIVTTERYNHHTFAALQQAAGRLESGKTFTSASQNSSETGGKDAVSESAKIAEGAEQKELSDLAGRQGFEPRYRGPEPRVLPLDDLPIHEALQAGSAANARCYERLSMPAAPLTILHGAIRLQRSLRRSRCAAHFPGSRPAFDHGVVFRCPTISPLGRHSCCTRSSVTFKEGSR
jgi:integrase